MADAYLTISKVAEDKNMQSRVAACAAQQARTVGAPIGDPTAWAIYNRLSWASSPTWAEKWDYALAVHPEEPDYEPGADVACITDGDVLATVQAMLPESAPNP